MKKKRVIVFFVIFAFIGISLINCKDDNVPDDGDVRVETVKLDEDLKKGLTVEVGSETINFA
ncbi:hypothetical protein [uncultured Proteiniphilum sp.]|jgi:hypothetical protein|uniref:hypothetical protein n=1 Tax=uncultured Proteiniphilum sp. TaxID=497637 RepID=UPI0026109A12|nr:hypothetical protein [uncultured Proteiniphilum sp.]